MYTELLKWDIYEITTSETPINGVMLRGRLRKFGLQEERSILAENTDDIDRSVRFAIPTSEDLVSINEYIHSVISDASISLVAESVPNPVLSKLKVNKEDRYTL